jgi:hypothetical protein
VAEGTRLLSEYGVHTPSRVRIPPSPSQLVAQLRRGAPRFTTQYAVQVALVGEADVGGEPREIALAAGQALERAAGAQPRAVPGDRVAGRRAEDAAQVVPGDRRLARELGQRSVRVGGERLAGAVDGGAPGARRRRTARADAAWVDLRERSRRERDRALHLVAVAVQVVDALLVARVGAVRGRRVQADSTPSAARTKQPRRTKTGPDRRADDTRHGRRQPDDGGAGDSPGAVRSEGYNALSLRP